MAVKTASYHTRALSIMEWLEAETLEDLKQLGSYRKMREEITNRLGNRIYFKARGWADLWEVVQSIRQLKLSGRLPQEIERYQASTSDENLMYFKSEADRIIYALLRLDGEKRLRELGINKSHTRDLEKAKSWRNQLARLIHPDVCKHPESVEASAELAHLYKQMTKR
jgi:hypothetical protein